MQPDEHRADQRTTPLIVVIVDDDPEHLTLIGLALEDQWARREVRPIEIQRFTDPGEALAQLPIDQDTVIVCDHRMPGTSGLQWLGDFVRADVGPVVIVSAQGDERAAAEAFRHGAADYLTKAAILEDPDAFARSIAETERRFRLERTGRRLCRELRSTNAELSRENARLREQTDTAHRFVDDVAHEFRTPLAVIREFASILADELGGPLTDAQREHVGFVLDATRDLAGLVDDFLDSSKLRARTLPVDRRPVPVESVLATVRPAIASRAARKRITLEQVIADGTPEAFGDAEKIVRTLVNLATNAVKFSPSGSTVRLAAGRAADGGVRLSVSDEGPGLEPAEIEAIFERFRQVGPAGRDESRGFGLGLNIASELVTLNLGTLDVHSTPGAGSTFAFTLPSSDPASILEHYVRTAAAARTSSALTILAIELPGVDDPRERLWSFVASAAAPMDLLLPGPNAGTLHLCGLTVDAREWEQRLRAAATRHFGFEHADVLRRLVIRSAGTWPIGIDPHVIHASLFSDLREARRA